MKKITVKLISLFLVLFLSFSSGCAFFPGNNVPVTALTPSTLSVKPKLQYEFNIKGTAFAAPPPAQEEFESILAKSNNFSEISRAPQDPDLKIEANLVVKSNGGGLVFAFLTGLSLYTIPSWGTDYYTLSAKVTAKNGTIKEYTLQDSARIVQWLPMLFVFVAKPPSVAKDVRDNMYTNLVEQIKKDNLLQITQDAGES